MAASEEYRAQAEARNRLEDTWKAGQEAAMFRWRAEQHAMQQVPLAAHAGDVFADPPEDRCCCCCPAIVYLDSSLSTGRKQ
jgi:hypothetical protein